MSKTLYPGTEPTGSPGHMNTLVHRWMFQSLQGWERNAILLFFCSIFSFFLSCDIQYPMWQMTQMRSQSEKWLSFHSKAWHMLGDAANLIKALIIVLPNDWCIYKILLCFTEKPKYSKATNGFWQAPGSRFIASQFFRGFAAKITSAFENVSYFLLGRYCGSCTLKLSFSFLKKSTSNYLTVYLPGKGNPH